MKEKTYKLTYDNGNILITNAYSMELHDGKLYQSCAQLYNDMPSISVINGSHIIKLEEV